MKPVFPVLLILFSVSFTGCALYRTSPKYEFKDEFYSVKHRRERHSIYVHNIEDTIKLYRLSQTDKIYSIDTANFKEATLPPNSDQPIESHSFLRNSFDVDFITIISKYRPVTKGFPNQFNTNLNGAGYVGYRTDVYQINYHQNRLGYYNRNITHYGLSFGGFAGVGSTAVNDWTTIPSVNKEYDGFVITKGLGVIIGINKLNFGLTVGWDNLLDKYKSQWIYQNRVWYGIALGLNLN